jgi:hypothetical protein
MSNYHRSTHRVKESTPTIVNWNDSYHNSFGRNLDEVGSKPNKIETALAKTRVAQKTFAENAKGPNKITHVNVSKATPETQKIVKGRSKKTGNDIYTYDNRRSKRK